MGYKQTFRTYTTSVPVVVVSVALAVVVLETTTVKGGAAAYTVEVTGTIDKAEVQKASPILGVPRMARRQLSAPPMSC